MSHEIIRIEDTVDSNNNPEMFIQVQFNSNGISIPFARWISGSLYNEVITDSDALNSLISSWEEYAVTTYVQEHGEQNQISKRQARLALLQSGLLETVNSVVNAAGEAAKIEWEYADFIDRNSPLLNSLALSLNISEQDLNSLFDLAKKL